MRILLKTLHFLYVIYAFTIFAALMLPVFVWAMFASLFGKIKGGNLVYYACTLWADIWFPLIFIESERPFQGI